VRRSIIHAWLRSCLGCHTRAVVVVGYGKLREQRGGTMSGGNHLPLSDQEGCDAQGGMVMERAYGRTRHYGCTGQSRPEGAPEDRRDEEDALAGRCSHEPRRGGGGASSDANADRKKYRWLTQLLARKPFRAVAVALANQMTRIAWALLAKGGTYRDAGAGGRGLRSLSMEG